MAYWLLKCALYPIGILPRWALRVLSDALSFLIYRIVGYRKSVVMSNLRQCFPQKTEAELKKIACGSYKNFCDLTLNMLRIRFVSTKRVLRTVRYANLELYQRYADRDMILFAAHYSCWEYIINTNKMYPQGARFIGAYQPMHGALERLICEGRTRFGARLAPLQNVFRTIFEFRNQGLHSHTLMVTDQSPAGGASDHWVTFLGQKTPVFIAPERIAQKTNSAVLYLRTTEIKRFYYEYEFVVLSENTANEEPSVVTQRFFAALEQDILRCPRLWMWTHKRWKNANLYN
jgi:KDO2-lipid IV(A) lauroyltransferase